MTCKTGRLSVCPSIRPSVRCQQIQNTKAPRTLWTNVDETWRVYSMGRGTKLLGSGIMNFVPCVARGHNELSRVGRDYPPRAGCFSVWPLLSLLSRTQTVKVRFYNDSNNHVLVRWKLHCENFTRSLVSCNRSHKKQSCGHYCSPLRSVGMWQRRPWDHMLLTRQLSVTDAITVTDAIKCASSAETCQFLNTRTSRCSPTTSKTSLGSKLMA